MELNAVVPQTSFSWIQFLNASQPYHLSLISSSRHFRSHPRFSIALSVSFGPDFLVHPLSFLNPQHSEFSHYPSTRTSLYEVTNRLHIQCTFSVLGFPEHTKSFDSVVLSLLQKCPVDFLSSHLIIGLCHGLLILLTVKLSSWVRSSIQWLHQHPCMNGSWRYVSREDLLLWAPACCRAPPKTTLLECLLANLNLNVIKFPYLSLSYTFLTPFSS